MTSNYKLIIGGSEVQLDPGLQWSDAELWDLVKATVPKKLPVLGGGAVTFMPGPGVAIVREESRGGPVF